MPADAENVFAICASGGSPTFIRMQTPRTGGRLSDAGRDRCGYPYGSSKRVHHLRVRQNPEIHTHTNAPHRRILSDAGRGVLVILADAASNFPARGARLMRAFLRKQRTHSPLARPAESRHSYAHKRPTTEATVRCGAQMSGASLRKQWPSSAQNALNRQRLSGTGRSCYAHTCGCGGIPPHKPPCTGIDAPARGAANAVIPAKTAHLTSAHKNPAPASTLRCRARLLRSSLRMQRHSSAQSTPHRHRHSGAGRGCYAHPCGSSGLPPRKTPCTGIDAPTRGAAVRAPAPCGRRGSRPGARAL